MILAYTTFPCQFTETICSTLAFSLLRIILVGPIPVMSSLGKKNSAIEGNCVSRIAFRSDILAEYSARRDFWNVIKLLQCNVGSEFFYSVRFEGLWLVEDRKSEKLIGQIITFVLGGSKSEGSHWL